MGLVKYVGYFWYSITPQKKEKNGMQQIGVEETVLNCSLFLLTCIRIFERRVCCANSNGAVTS